jgi:hypothetical protein
MSQVRSDIKASEYAEAFRSVRAAKTFFWFLLGLAILVQVTGFSLVEFAGVLDPGMVPAKPKAAGAPARVGKPTPASQPNEGDVSRANLVRNVLSWAMPISRDAAPVLCTLLVLTLLLAVKLCLVGRLSGIAGFIGAFFWSLILLAIVVPWQRIFPSAYVMGSLFDFDELLAAAGHARQAWGAAELPLLDKVFYYGRFLAYPAVALLVWLIVQFKFGRGARRMAAAAQERPASLV